VRASFSASAEDPLHLAGVAQIVTTRTRSTSCRCLFRPFANSSRSADATLPTTVFGPQAPTGRFVPTTDAAERQSVRLEVQDRLMAAQTAHHALHALQ
jgi:hypothetical protein